MESIHVTMAFCRGDSGREVMEVESIHATMVYCRGDSGREVMGSGQYSCHNGVL